MAILGVRELRERASEVIRRVREERAEYVVTYQGRPVAVILPQAEAEMVAASKKAIADGWKRYLQTVEEIRQVRPSGVSTQDVIDAVRR